MLPSSLPPLDSSTLVLSLLTLLSLLVIYLQHKNILPSPYFRTPTVQTPPQPSGSKTARCRECSKQKPISQLKLCSNCRLTPDQNPSTDLNFYYCDQSCQKSNWKTHKLVCGNFKNLQSTSLLAGAPSSSLSSPPANLVNSQFESQRTEIEGLIKKWCDFHKSLLIFATIHGLDLIRSPTNSTKILLMISLNFNQDSLEGGAKIVELPAAGAAGPKADDPIDPKIHESFSVAHIGSLDSANFFAANPGMMAGSQEMDKVRSRVREKGGVGVGILLVRYGPIVHIIPVGLPSQADLDAVPRQPKWRAIFDEAIKSGQPWKPPSTQ